MAKIGIIISSLFAYGGEERVVSLMANEWVKYHEVTIFTFENREAEKNSKSDFILSDRLLIERVNNTGSNKFRTFVKLLYFQTGLSSGPLSQRILKDAFYPKQLLDEWVDRINGGAYDLIIAISGVCTMLLGYIREQICAKTICWEHSSYEGYFDSKNGYYRNRIDSYRKCASKIDVRVVLNEDIQKKYEKYLGLETVVIYNPKSFCNDEKVDGEKKCFVTCGRVEAEKGFDDLIEAFAEFCKNRGDWKLIIIGGGSLQNKCEQIARKRKIADRVVITGYTNKVKEYLLQGSVFVMTSRWEGFPMTILEALELGIPILSYDIPALQPLVKNGEEGWIVPAFDRTKLVEAMKELADDVELRKKMSEKAIVKATQFEPDKIVRKWLNIFDELLNGQG